MADWRELLDSHRQTIETGDSWHGAAVVQYGGDEAALTESEQNATIAGAVRDDERRRVVERENETFDSYTTGRDAPTFVQYNRSGNVTYQQSEQAISYPLLAQPASAEFLGGFEFTDHGTVDTEQGQRLKLTVDDVARMGETARSNVRGEVTAVSLEVLVDTEQDVITQVDYQLTVEREEGTATIGVGIVVLGIDSSTVDQPTWLDEARTRTD